MDEDIKQINKQENTMKTLFLTVAAAAGAVAVTAGAHAQDIPLDQVPSVVRNSFETAFPKAKDIDWEKEGALYNVEFETGRRTDHEAWYDASGKLVKHKQDISRKELPSEVNRVIEREFKGYRVDDMEKITAGTTTTYRLELDSRRQDWIITVDANGKILDKTAD